MIEFHGDAILLDIEGTTSSVTFVYDVMFPYVRKNLGVYLSDHWSSPRLEELCGLVAADADAETADKLLDSSLPAKARQGHLAAEVLRQMDRDMKVTGLKALQGDIWKAGFESGALVSHVYEDVVPCLKAWRASNLATRIYSSGSVAAQKLFFGHTAAGNLLEYFEGHYDTTIGDKRSSLSYAAIASDWNRAPESILFVSDVTAELDAAKETGMKTTICCRAESAEGDHPICHTFEQIRIC